MSGRGDGAPERRGSRRRAGGDADPHRLQVALAAQAAVATPLSELAVTARDVSRVQPLLERVLAAVADVLRTDMAAVWVMDTVADELYAVAWTGLPDDYLLGLRVPVGSGSAGRAVAERAPVLIADTSSAPEYAPYREGALEHGIRTAYSTPMLTLSGEPMGALTAYHSEPYEPSARARRLVATLAGQAGEMVERARMHAEARQLAALERRRGEQLRGLADAAMALTAGDTLDDLLRLVTEAAVSLIGCHQGVATRLSDGWANASTYVALSEKYAAWRGYDLVPKGIGALLRVTGENRPLRLTGEQLRQHPEWRAFRDAPDHPPLPDYLAAPLVGRDGRNLGLVQLSHKTDETAFTGEDEAILVQLAQMASSAIERLEALEREVAARRDAERAARLRGVLSEASAAFAASLEPAEVGEQLVRVVVPRLAEIAVLHVLDEQRQVALATLRTSDPVLERAAWSWFESSRLDPASPYGPHQVLRTGQLQLLPEMTDDIAQQIAPTPDAAVELRRIVRRSCLIVPLTARGRTIGALSLSRDEPYGDQEVEYAVDLARRAALGLDNASRYAFERELAGTLQRSLLPREMPVSALMTAAARYLPGARGTQIGGDWYDLLEVDDGGLVLVVGDVMGRGVQAASVMGQLRSAVRAFALEGHQPADILRLVDRVVQGLDELHFTTCLVGRLDPVRRTLCVAAAGHLSPLVIGADGVASFLELDPGLPLGVGGAQFVEQAVQLDAGGAVLVYTDGLVEGRDQSVDEGMSRLRAAADGPMRSAEELCDRVLQATGRDGDHDDDTALLVVLLDDGSSRGDSEPLVLDLPGVPESAAVARAALLDLLDQHGRSDLADTAALLVTELVANTARHVGGEVRVRAGVRAGLLLVEVSDEVEDPPVLRRAGAEQESGRGVLLVEALADRWGTDALPTGKRVWFELGAAGAP